MAKLHKAATLSNKSIAIMPVGKAERIEPEKGRRPSQPKVGSSVEIRPIKSRRQLMRWCVQQVKCQEPVQRMPAGYVKVFDELIEEFELVKHQQDYGPGIDGWSTALISVFEHLAETEGFVTCGASVSWIPAEVYAKAIRGTQVELDYLFDLCFRALGLEKFIAVSEAGDHLRWQSKEGFVSKFGFAFDVQTKITYGTALFCTRSDI